MDRVEYIKLKEHHFFVNDNVVTIIIGSFMTNVVKNITSIIITFGYNGKKISTLPKYDGYFSYDLDKYKEIYSKYTLEEFESLSKSCKAINKFNL